MTTVKVGQILNKTAENSFLLFRTSPFYLRQHGIQNVEFDLLSIFQGDVCVVVEFKVEILNFLKVYNMIGSKKIWQITEDIGVIPKEMCIVIMVVFLQQKF